MKHFHKIHVLLYVSRDSFKKGIAITDFTAGSVEH